MLRTRDFLLFLLTVVFLVVGIISTIDSNSQHSWYGFDFMGGDHRYDAFLPENKSLDREERLEIMREKVAKVDIDENLASVVVATISEDDEDKESSNDMGEMNGEIKKCVNYSNVQPVWSPAGLKFEVVEGARVFYREIPSLTNSTGTLPVRENVLQLPLRSGSLGVSQCLDHSVVGVALDGSLINNEDYTAYKIFSAETLIGYALDGFPIYGLNASVKTDSCGGVLEGGQYRYYLSDKREGMIGCFAGEPVEL